MQVVKIVVNLGNKVEVVKIVVKLTKFLVTDNLVTDNLVVNLVNVKLADNLVVNLEIEIQDVNQVIKSRELFLDNFKAIILVFVTLIMALNAKTKLVNQANYRAIEISNLVKSPLKNRCHL